MKHSEMVERVARAIAKRQGSTLEAMRPTVATKYLHMAYAALEALREPTQAMCVAGMGTKSAPDDSEAAWVAMIDAALGK